MSGLEPLVALSLACNILQIAGTGRETIRAVRQIYEDGTLDPTLLERASDLKSLAKRTQDICTPAPAAAPSGAPTSTRGAAPVPGPRPQQHEKQLSDLATKCMGAARDLQEEINFLNGVAASTKLATTLKIAAKTTWRKRRLDKLDQRLVEAERTLQTGLMARLM